MTIKAEIIGPPEDQALNFTRDGENIGLLKFNHTADRELCRWLAHHLSQCDDFEVVDLREVTA